MTEAAGRRAAGDHEDGADGAVLGEVAGGVAGGGEDQDGAGVDVERGADGGHGDGLDDGGWAHGEVAHLLEVGDVGDGVLGLEARLVHLGDGGDGVGALGRLAGEHDAVGAVGDGVADVGDLGAGWARVVDHGLEHLGGADDGLAGHVAHGDHLLLGGEDFGGGDLDAEVTTGDHDSVGLLEDLGEVVEALSVLDLGDDLDVRAGLAEDVADGGDVLAAADEGGEDHVDVVLDAEEEIGLVLVGEGGEIDVGVGEVDALLGGDLAVVAGPGADGLVVDDLEDIEGEHTVIDVDDAAWGDHLGDVLVVDVPGVVSYFFASKKGGQLTCSGYQRRRHICRQW